MGGVFTDKVIVQRLTDMKWIVLSSTEESERARNLAKVLVALRKCIEKLCEFYLDKQNLPPFVPDEPHPRYFPYPKSFPDPAGTCKTSYIHSEPPMVVLFCSNADGRNTSSAGPL